MRQLSGLDASFLNLESSRAPMHLTSLLIYDQSTAPDGRVTFKQILAKLEEKVNAIPALRERIARVPLDLSYPWWIDDTNFDLEFHVRHIALPHPGDWRQLCIQVARLASRPLDLARPPWEMTVIEGLDNVHGYPPGCFALVLKTHHSAIDGESGMELLGALQEFSPAISESGPLAPWQPGRAPSPVGMFAKAVTTVPKQPIETLRSVGRLVPGLARLAIGLQARELGLPPRMLRARKTRFSGAVTPHRVMEGIPIDLDDLRALRAAVPGATVNDACLSIVGGAMRHYLVSHGESVDEPLLAMVPISVRDERSPDAGNQVSAMVASLGSEFADALERLAAVRASTQASKALTNAVGARALTGLAMHVPALMATLGAKLAVRASVTNQAGRMFNTIVTNVPGPQVPTYFSGAQLLAHYGMGPIMDGVGILHSMMSADGKIFLAATSCRQMMPDPGHYADCLRQSLDESLAAARRATGSPRAEPVGASRRSPRGRAPAAVPHP